ncbi:MAG: hypothetical protein NTX52_04645, partial [Planctomycetota bacterium]|nr:hypothetical protein [Planctomycetota bacterium]
AGGIGYVGSTAGNGAQLYQITYNTVFVEAPNYLIEARVRTARSSDGLWGSGVAVEMYAYGWAYVGSLTYMFDEAEKAEGMNVWHDIAMEIDTYGWTQAAFDGWGVTASLRREGYAASGMVEFDSISMIPIPKPATSEVGCVWMAKDWHFKTDPTKAGVAEQWYAVSFDDSAWDIINAGQRYEDQGYANYDGDSWYRKWVSIPSDWSGKSIQLEFGSVDWCNLYINGTFVSRSAGSLALHISSYLQAGQDNLICCRIEDTGGDGGIVTKPVQLVLLDPSVPIGLSKAMPVVNDQVTITVYVSGSAGQQLSITSPLSQTTVKVLDPNSQTLWQPNRYGQYTLTYGSISETVWVTAGPLMFHYWDGSVFQKYITHVFAYLNTRPERAASWTRRGVVLETWAGGVSIPFDTAEQWFNSWKSTYESGPYEGILIDELYMGKTHPYDEVPKAVLLTRESEGPDFHLAPYISGLERDNDEGFWNLRQAGAQVLWENYYGDEALFRQRWLDLKLFNMEKIGGVFSLGPGFQFPQGGGGPLTVLELRDVIAQARRVAPEMKGLSFFNAYFTRDLDFACEHLIEKFFLEPIIHIHPRNGNVVFQNIGNEDTPATITASFYQRSTFRSTITLPVLAPNEEYAALPPSGADRVVLNTPSTMENLYKNGLFVFPDTLYPLQVVSSSVQEGEKLVLDSTGVLVMTFVFNKDVASVDSSYIWMKGVSSGKFSPSLLQYDSPSRTLTVEFSSLPTDYYTLRLLSQNTCFRDTSGKRLDGSGNGFIEGSSVG